MPKYKIITNTAVTKVRVYLIEAESKQAAISEWQNGADWEDETESENIEHFGRIEETNE